MSLPQYNKEISSLVSEADFLMLEDVLCSRLFSAMMGVQNGVHNARTDSDALYPSAAVRCAREVLQVAKRKKSDKRLEELSKILQGAECQAFIMALDIIATEKLVQKIPTYNDVDMKLVFDVVVEKQPGETLGATIKCHPVSGRASIARILHGGSLHRNGKLSVGDEIIEINGMDVQELSLDEVVALLSFEPGAIHLKVITSSEMPKLRSESYKVFVRACFSYDPSVDPQIPCPDAGLAFHQKDILEVMDTNETRWWQARRIGDKTMKIGIIPSKRLQERRLALNRKLIEDNGQQTLVNSLSSSMSPDSSMETSLDASGGHSLMSLLASSNASTSELLDSSRGVKGKGRKKIRYNSYDMNKFYAHQLLTYEEVTQITPDPCRRRPVAIVGAPGVGCSEICRRLTTLRQEEVKTPLQYSSKLKSSGKPRLGYEAAKRSAIAKGIQRNTLIKQKDIDGELYAVSVESIYATQDQQMTCIFEVDPWSLGALKKCSFIPYIVFIKCPTIDTLLSTRPKDGALGSQYKRTYSDADFVQMVLDSKQIEAHCDHYIDLKLINEDLETTVNQLYHSIRRLSVEPQWVSLSGTT